MKDIENKRLYEQRVVGEMIFLYCKKKHKSKELCEECKQVLAYCERKTRNCPFMEEKTFCSNCKEHCYSPKMREKIREVMRFSGPRMILHRPLLVIKHMYYGIKERKKRKNNGKKKID